MSKKTNTVAINGKHYDVKTGAVIARSSGLKNIDGIVSHATSALDTSPGTVSASRPALIPLSGPSSMDILPGHRQLNPLKSHRPQPTHTLMRRAVQPPSPKSKPKGKALSPLDRTLPPLQTHRDLEQIDHKRSQRAKIIKQNKLVSRFGSGEYHESSQLAVISVSAAPAAQALPHESVPQAKQRSLDIFERAIDQAISHEQKYTPPRKSHRRRRVGYILSLSILVIAVGGFLIQQNVNNVKVYLASAKAGFSVSLPGYVPNGFTLADVRASAGSAVETFRDGSAGHSFVLTEEPSDWDTTTLQEAYVNNMAGANFQTILSAGRTIFFYNTVDATWVSGGMWYVLHSAAPLTDSQLIQIANSL